MFHVRQFLYQKGRKSTAIAPQEEGIVKIGSLKLDIYDVCLLHCFQKLAFGIGVVNCEYKTRLILRQHSLSLTLL